MADRAEDAARCRALLAANPADRIAWHNLAAAAGDLGNAEEAESAARRAIALGIKAPETRLVLGRALLAQRRLADARRAFEEALRLRPDYVDAHRDLAQLTWMETGDIERALEPLEKCLKKVPRHPGLSLVRSIALEYAGDEKRALECARVALEASTGDFGLLRQAARLSARLGDVAQAWQLAGRAAAAAPRERAGRVTLCEAALAAGRLEEAERTAQELYRSDPTDQYGLALLATTWRLRSDPRYEALYDYRSLVAVQELETPAGWASPEAFLEALAADLGSLHAYRTHPLEQSVRGGSQLPLYGKELERPLVAALFESIWHAVRAYSRRLGSGSDPLRARNTPQLAISGAWSIRLRSGGHHTDHVHQGLFSSACYVSVPEEVHVPAPGAHPGWLRLGRPGIPTSPPIEADHYIEPAPGRLVLFPAYMWHGVEPFASDQPRLSVAFDVVPDAGRAPVL